MRIDDVIGGKTMRGEPVVEGGDEIGQIALALGQREAAGRQRDTGHGVAAQSRPWRQQPRLARYRLDLRLLFRRHIGDDRDSGSG